MEVFKDIIWYEWKYQVSNLGNVKSLNYNRTHKENILKKLDTIHWYIHINLYKDGKIKVYKIHRIVAISFIPNPDNKPCVNHINWIKDDNRVENLEWCTYSENQIHKYRVLWYKNKNNLFIKNHPNKWKFWIKHNRSKKVNQYDLDWNFIKTWWWFREINRELWIDKW
jgi:hypothetical protein